MKANLPLTAALRARLDADEIDVGDVLEAYAALELAHQAAGLAVDASRADQDDYANIHKTIRALLEPHFPPSTIASCIRDLLADKQRMDKLELDGALKALWESQINLKHWDKGLWNVREALDKLPEPAEQAPSQEKFTGIAILAHRAYPNLQSSLICSRHHESGHFECSICYPDLNKLLEAHMEVSNELYAELLALAGLKDPPNGRIGTNAILAELRRKLRRKLQLPIGITEESD